MSDQERLASLVAKLDKVNFDTFGDALSRAKALVSGRALVTQLETPFETLFHMGHEVPGLNAALHDGMEVQRAPNS